MPKPLRHIPYLVLCLVPLLLSGCLFGSGGGKEGMLQPASSGQAIPYIVDLKLAESSRKPDGAAPASTNAEKDGQPSGTRTNDPDGLLSELRDNSQLIWLQNDLPDSKVALERRVLEDMETAKKILRSNGYYDGTVSRRIDWNSKPVSITIRLRPRQQYVIGSTRLLYSGAQPVSGTPPTEEDIARHGKNFMLNAPDDLTSFGLPKGIPAKADTVLTAVDQVLKTMHNEGYPFARMGESHYIIDRSTSTLDAEVTIETGPLLRMGFVTVKETDSGTSSVGTAYLNRLTTWTRGQYWNESLLTSYRTALQETGLFSAIVMKPELPDITEKGTPETNSASGSLSGQEQTQQGATASAGNGMKSFSPEKGSLSSEKTGSFSENVFHDRIVPVSLDVRDAPPRTVSGGMQYSTDTGFGVRGSWEHRNLLGNGEQLRISAPIAQTEQRLSATFRKPAFGGKNRTLVGEAELINEETDAYDQTAAYAAGGIERRFSGDWRNWWGSARLSVEGGRLDDNIQGKQSYLLLGLPLGLRRDTTDDLLNPTRGTRLTLAVTPYTGTYTGQLQTLRTRVDASGYWSPFSGNRLVLAGRMAAGSLIGESVSDIPASLRFYTGGGGSVRGYKYQSLGPKDREGDPVGGLSFNDISLEARFKITEQFGIVPFIDGGMVYDQTLPEWGRDLAWGAGIGFRYYTLIGPIRLDIATPLQDRDDNKAFQIYLSIGQAF